MKLRCAVLVSGGGTNLQAVLDAEKRGEIPHAEIALVVSSKRSAFALERAKEAGVPAFVHERQTGALSAEYLACYDRELAAVLHRYRIDIVVLAGFLVVLQQAVLSAYPDSIINVHPSLLPAFGGPGCYGLHVHKKVLAAGVKITGATVHLVNGTVDGGKIVLQKTVEVLPDDNPETLQRRVMEQAEWVILPQALEMLCAAKL